MDEEEDFCPECAGEDDDFECPCCAEDEDDDWEFSL